MAKFTVFGLQRSGTNFLEELIKKNLSKVEIQNRWAKGGIWKHAYNIEHKSNSNGSAGQRGDPKKEKEIGKSINAVYVVKHPYSWIQSITRKEVDIKKTYPFVVADNGNLDIEQLAKLYVEHTSYWLSKIFKDGRRIHLIRYEDLVESPEATKQNVKSMADTFGMTLINPNKIVIPEKVGQSERFTEDRRRLYVKYKITTLDFERIKAINAVLRGDGTNYYAANPDCLEHDLIDSEEEFERRKQ